MTIAADMPEASAKRRPGRPRGTDYRRIDAPLHEEMRRLVEDENYPSLSAAAWAVVARAYGGGSPGSKAKRLVRWYPYPRPEPR